MKKFQIIIFFLYLFSLAANLEAVIPLENDILHFTTEEMRIPTPQECESYSLEYPQVYEALTLYHQTAPYTQSGRDFIQNPNFYFQNRLDSLEHLIRTLENNASSSSIQNLLNKAQNKRRYLIALPSTMNPKCTKPEFLDPSITQKSIFIKDSYWHEVLDPIHRYGTEISILRLRWQASSNPNYFIYLDTIENHPLINKYVPQKFQIKYFHTQEEREAHRVSFKNGLAYLGNKLLDTSANAMSSSDGTTLFTVGLDNELYVLDHIKYILHHSSEFAGYDVLSAGELSARKGIINKINNKSGHYSPSLSDLIAAIDLIKQKLGRVDNMTATAILAKKTDLMPIQANFNAVDLLATNGNAIPISAQFGWTPLHIVVWRKQFDLADSAIKPEHLNVQNDLGLTPLHIAAQNQSLDWISKLLEHGANPNIYSKAGLTPIHTAINTGNLEAIKLLYPHSLPLHTSSGESFLHLAVKKGDLDLYKFFHDRNFSLEDTDNSGNHIFFFAVASENQYMLHYLLTTIGPRKIYLKNIHDASLLHQASAFGTPQIINKLLEFQLDPHHSDADGNTLLHYASKHGNWPAIEYLLKINLSWMAKEKNKQGVTPLHLGSLALDYQHFPQFLTNFSAIDIQDSEGNSPLVYALKGENYRNMSILLESGANTRLLNNDGKALIHIAAKSSYNGLLMLLSYSNDIELLDAEGNTPLHIALAKSHIQNALYLISYSSKETLEHRNAKGMNALDLAKTMNNPDILKKLQNKLQNLN